MTSENKISEKTSTITGIFVCVLLFALSILISPRLAPGHDDSARAINLFISRLYLWTALLLLWIFCRRIEKKEFLMWKDKSYSGLLSVVSVIALMCALMVGVIIIGILLLYFGVPKDSDKLKMMVRIFDDNLLLMFFTTISAGVIEELSFRGYLLPRLISFVGNFWGIVISSVLFGLLHVGYGNLHQIIIPAVIGVIFAVYYVKFRNLKILIFTHFLWDTVVLLLRMAITHYQKQGVHFTNL